MKGMLKPISNTATGGASLFALSATTDRIGESSLCGPITRIFVLCRSGISKSTSVSLKGKAEQVGLNSLVVHCFGKARSIMRQKHRKAQPETTVHKDMARDEFARQIAPGVGRHLRDALEQAKQLKRERSGDE